MIDLTSPAVSVIIPVRNGKEFIDEALDSVLTQSFSDLEIVIIDDGSTDFDYTLLSERDARIRVFRREGNGVSAARNFGMRQARGCYFAFLDADDVWYPGKLEAQIRYFDRHPEVGCVFGGFVKWNRDPISGEFPPAGDFYQDCAAVEACDPQRSGWIYTRLLMGLLVGMNTAVIRREVYQCLGGFDESMRIGEDYLFWLKIAKVYEMHALAAIVALYRIHSASAMNRLSSENHQARLLHIAQARWGLEDADGGRVDDTEFRLHLAETEFTHGYNHFWHGDGRTAARAFRRSVYGGFMIRRSVVYLLLLPFRRWLNRRSLNATAASTG